MQALTYKDIIDDKTEEWRRNLKKLEEQAGQATSDTRAKLIAKIEKLKSAIDTAVVNLHALDKQETVDNTMETKDKILKIFNSIDKDFMGFEGKTPFML